MVGAWNGDGGEEVCGRCDHGAASGRDVRRSLRSHRRLAGLPQRRRRSRDGRLPMWARPSSPRSGFHPAAPFPSGRWLVGRRRPRRRRRLHRWLWRRCRRRCFRLPPGGGKTRSVSRTVTLAYTLKTNQKKSYFKEKLGTDKNQLSLSRMLMYVAYGTGLYLSRERTIDLPSPLDPSPNASRIRRHISQRAVLPHERCAPRPVACRAAIIVVHEFLWDDLDIAEAELGWLSNFFDDNDSFTADFPKCGTTIGANYSNSNSGKSEEDSLFRTSSPVSVLEPNSLSIGGSGGGASSSSSSCSGTGGGNSGARAQDALPISHPEPILVVPARARSKRPRPATFSRPHVTIPFLPPSSDSIPVASSSSQSESFGESNPGPATMTQKKNKTKKSSAGTAAGGDEAPPVRKCMHCEIQKTPQWRAGPMGPKTLCNACGVRYKSGRLFPEYRPAASPTFVPDLHSNSHKKVVEMRIKASQASKDSCDLLAYIRRRE
ncbi:uncharacterized protein [Elaeis guineensis]|uniref:uncharacterized protein isoform X1 n=1 Tax=Elaeis guineensis var. tenera TaxID=51953 RepID=UPI003C6D3884